MDCDASIYDEMLFIFITGKGNKYFLNDGPKLLRNRPKIIIFTKQMWASNAKDEFKYVCKYVYGMAAWKTSANIFAVNPWTGNYGDEMN